MINGEILWNPANKPNLKSYVVQEIASVSNQDLDHPIIKLQHWLWWVETGTDPLADGLWCSTTRCPSAGCWMDPQRHEKKRCGFGVSEDVTTYLRNWSFYANNMMSHFPLDYHDVPNVEPNSLSKPDEPGRDLSKNWGALAHHCACFETGDVPGVVGFYCYNWLVVWTPPLWKIWVRQLEWFTYPIFLGK